MRLAIAAFAALLFANVAHADSGQAYDITGSADFAVAGQNFDVSFSYTVDGPLDEASSASNIQFATSGNFGAFTLLNPYPLDLQWSNTGNPNDGVTFDLAVISLSSPGGLIEMNLYDLPTYPFDVFVPSSSVFQITPISTPEPSTWGMLVAGLGLAALRRRKKA